jgi:hypothetical protein
MTNPDYTHLTLVVDRSGSMESMRSEAEQGINQLLADQAKIPGRFTVTIVQFDSEVETVSRMDVWPAPYQLVPRGMTALLDAVGSEIVATGEDLTSLPEDSRPAKVVFVVVTDGQENSSHDWDLDRVRAAIGKQKADYQWAFQFLGAGESAWQGADLGMATTRYSADGAGTTRSYQAMNAALTNLRAAPANADAVFSMPETIDGDSGS